MNKKLLIFGITGWGSAALAVIELARVYSVNKKLCNRVNEAMSVIEQANQIIVDDRFQEIVDNYDEL